MNIIKFIFFLNLISLLYFTCVDISSASTLWHVDDDFRDYIGGNFASIQDGINAANDGDTIIIYPGTYFENVIVDKHLTIRGVDTGGGMPVIDAGINGSGIILYADQIMLEGVKVMNSGHNPMDAGIKVNSNNNIIINNTICNNKLGILFDFSNNNNITDNNVENNDIGFKLISSNKNNLISNNANNNIKYGIELYSVKFNQCTNNTIVNNTACSNGDGGILLHLSNNNNITGNNASWNNVGIWLTSSRNNEIIANKANNNNYHGLLLYESSHNIITGNNVINNDNGIIPSIDNIIYLNNFINNDHNVYISDLSNIWNSTNPIVYKYNNIGHINYLGNYFSDYAGSDSDVDGIGNTAYSIDLYNQDGYPLIRPTWNYFASENITKIPYTSNSTETVSSNPSILKPIRDLLENTRLQQTCICFAILLVSCVLTYAVILLIDQKYQK